MKIADIPPGTTFSGEIEITLGHPVRGLWLKRENLVCGLDNPAWDAFSEGVVEDYKPVNLSMAVQE